METKTKQTNSNELKAKNEAFVNALKSLDIKVFGDYLKVWEHSTFKHYNRLNNIGKKKSLCQIIIECRTVLNDEQLYHRAKKWFDEHNREVLNK